MLSSYPSFEKLSHLNIKAWGLIKRLVLYQDISNPNGHQKTAPADYNITHRSYNSKEKGEKSITQINRYQIIHKNGQFKANGKTKKCLEDQDWRFELWRISWILYLPYNEESPHFSRVQDEWDKEERIESESWEKCEWTSGVTAEEGRERIDKSE